MLKYISFMKDALSEAKKAYSKDEVPVGAVIVKDNKIIARAHNITESENCSIKHAEIVAIEKACEFLGEKYLSDCSIYVTLQPCLMCMGAIVNSRIKRIYFGAREEICTDNHLQYNLYQNNIEVYDGIMEDECKKILKDFFKEKRNCL